eukprot:6083006-Alexandrium_andersonii.AAC.1
MEAFQWAYTMMMVICPTLGEQAQPGVPCGCRNIGCDFRHREDHGRSSFTRLPVALRHLAASSELGI